MVCNPSSEENRDIILANDSRCARNSGPTIALRMKKLGSGERLSNLFTGVPDQVSGRSSLSPGPSWPLSSAAHLLSLPCLLPRRHPFYTFPIRVPLHAITGLSPCLAPSAESLFPPISPLPLPSCISPVPKALTLVSTCPVLHLCQKHLPICDFLPILELNLQ